ncbi:MAG: HAMP domain-containing histidine kinase, partial [Acidimicrobiia bacterium]|nr:HAMP domain-containing histidine kinase [Acidimicrobiia bacterium]
ERWRTLTIEVLDVPEAGDEALVELVAPLGNVESETQLLRRRAWLLGLLAAVGAGLAGYVFGAYASRPITALRRDTERLDDANPERWRVGESFGTPEVDDVAATLNHSLGRLAEETERRGAALESARSFASAATHELRVPLQGALTNLNLAGDERLGGAERREVLGLATDQVRRMATALTAVRALAEAEFADPSWFAPVDLVDIVDAVVADESRGAEASVELVAQGEQGTRVVWPDGVRLAVGNVVRNAVVHGRPPGGEQPRIVVTVDGHRVSVDDNGPGIPAEDRARVLNRFERGSATPGSGLGLAIARQVATAHQGTIELTVSPLGGTRAVLTLGPDEIA